MCIWESILPLFRELEKLELSPTSWKQIRQMRVPRPGKGVRSVDGAFHASSLRPICIMSSWYRLHATARWRSATVHWISQWWPETACGGRRGRSINHTLDLILGSAAAGCYVAAFGCSLASDMADRA